VRNTMTEASSAVEEKMAYLARIREKKVICRVILCTTASVEYVA